MHINVTRRVTHEVTPLQVLLTTKASLGRVAQRFCVIYVWGIPWLYSIKESGWTIHGRKLAFLSYPWNWPYRPLSLWRSNLIFFFFSYWEAFLTSQNSKEYLNQSEASGFHWHRLKGITNTPPYWVSTGQAIISEWQISRQWWPLFALPTSVITWTELQSISTLLERGFFVLAQFSRLKKKEKENQGKKQITA